MAAHPEKAAVLPPEPNANGVEAVVLGQHADCHIACAEPTWPFQTLLPSDSWLTRTLVRAELQPSGTQGSQLGLCWQY